MSKTTKKISTAALHKQRAARMERATAKLLIEAENSTRTDFPTTRKANLFAAAREYAAAVRALAGVKS